jgi:hypothetical protein
MVVVYADSGYRSDVQSAVDSVVTQGGGTVRIPAGYYEWSITDQITKAPTVPLSIIGASPVGCLGNAQNWQTFSTGSSTHTILYKPPGQTGGNFMSLGGDTYGNYTLGSVRISSIQFQTDSPANITEEPGGRSGVSFRQIPNYRLDHCNFINMAGAACIASASSGWGDPDVSCYGVIDHCTVDNPYKLSGDSWVWAYGFYPIGNYRAGYNWTDKTAYDVVGTCGWHKGISTMYIEDCYLSRCRHGSDGTSGGWTTVRYTKMDRWGNEYTVGMTGNHDYGVGTETYNNTLIGPVNNLDPWGDPEWILGCQLRGGLCLFYNNYAYTDTYNVNHCLISIAKPVADNPVKGYFWNNTYNSNMAFLTNPGGYVENTDYFLRAPNQSQDGFTYRAYPYPHPATLKLNKYFNILTNSAGFKKIFNTSHPTLNKILTIDRVKLQ